MARHPKHDQLEEWLNGGHSDLDEHLATCERCASTLDHISLTVSNDDPEPSDIGPALLTLLEPPSDLHERISVRLAARLQRREDIELIGSMLGVPRETGELFMVAPNEGSESGASEDVSEPDSDAKDTESK